MPTDTKPFYRHILGTHWKDKPNKGLDVEVKKKKKKRSAIFFKSQAASHKRAVVCLNSGTGSAETSQTGATANMGTALWWFLHSAWVFTSTAPVDISMLHCYLRYTKHDWQVPREKPATRDQRANIHAGEKVPRKIQASMLAHCSVVWHAWTLRQRLQQWPVRPNIEENGAGVATHLRLTDEAKWSAIILRKRVTMHGTPNTNNM